LTPASGRQDHTASPSATAAFVIRRHRVHRIPPRVRDDREPPLSSGETGGAIEMICPTGEAKYFCKQGWTANSLICPSGNQIELLEEISLSEPRTEGRNKAKFAAKPIEA
jgi:hypothetical protein